MKNILNIFLSISFLIFFALPLSGIRPRRKVEKRVKQNVNGEQEEFQFQNSIVSGIRSTLAGFLNYKTDCGLHEN